MIIRHVDDVEAVTPEGVEGVTMRVAIGKPEGAPRFALREFELKPGAATPKHAHWWEHEVYVLSGQGEVLTEDGYRPLRAGDTVFVPGDEEHQFRNRGDGPLKFICVIPHVDAY